MSQNNFPCAGLLPPSGQIKEAVYVESQNNFPCAGLLQELNLAVEHNFLSELSQNNFPCAGLLLVTFDRVRDGLDCLKITSPVRGYSTTIAAEYNNNSTSLKITSPVRGYSLSEVYRLAKESESQNNFPCAGLLPFCGAYRCKKRVVSK